MKSDDPKPDSEVYAAMLSRREAVRIALAGDWPGRVLRGELVIDDGFVRDLVGLEGEAIPWAARRAVARRLDHDLVVVPFSGGWGSDEQIDPADAEFLLGQWRAESDLFVFALVDGPFSAAVRALGWEEALLRFTAGPAEMQEFMAEVVVALSEQVARLAEHGAEGILIGDDIAYRRNTYVRPAALRRSYFPFLTVLVDAAQAAGLPVVFHSDGNLWEIVDDLVASGINGLQGLEPGAGMSLARGRERAGPYLCLWGNVDVGWLSQPLAAQEIQEQVNRLLDPVRGSPVILGTSGGLMAGLPAANVEAMCRAG